MGLTEFYTQMVSEEEEHVKQASDMEKMAAEEEAAGRIFARGFVDELNKLAAAAYGEQEDDGR